MGKSGNPSIAAMETENAQLGYWQQLWGYLRTKANGKDGDFLGAGAIGLILPAAMTVGYFNHSLAWTEWLYAVSVGLVSLAGISALALPKSQRIYPRVPGPLIVFAATTSILVAVASAYFKAQGWPLH